MSASSGLLIVFFLLVLFVFHLPFLLLLLLLLFLLFSFSLLLLVLPRHQGGAASQVLRAVRARLLPPASLLSSLLPLTSSSLVQPFGLPLLSCLPACLLARRPT
ncbi:unnamed protein product [Prorocentrum cordatum]|uniref:Transmembrane protein n=1 Tax=Prorocentrum cordatum TaxID=2364126 RepID=A0ABN9SYA9_9DINO|nr:unnamed protein product [Polarella glacialis]